MKFFCCLLIVCLPLLAVTMAAPVEDLVFLADFDTSDVALLGANEFLPLPLDDRYRREGRFGQGYFFEKEQHNLLPPDLADPAKRLDHFRLLNGAAVRLIEADSPIAADSGTVIELALPQADAGLVVAADVEFTRQRGHEKRVTLLTSAHVRGPAGARLRLTTQFLPAALPAPEQAPDEEPRPREDDQFDAVEIILSGNWQRIACYTSGDSRLTQRRAAFTVQALDSMETLLLDGFQFEQAAYYPHHHHEPSSWVSPGTSTAASFIDLGDTRLQQLFPHDAGTIAFWTRTVHHSNLRGLGSSYWITFNRGYNANLWAISDYRVHAGADFVYFRQPQVTDGDWHHLALTWGGGEAAFYVDGKEIQSWSTSNLQLTGSRERYRLRLGAGIPAGQTADAVMDEIAIFKRPLKADEILELARRQEPIAPKGAAIRLGDAARSVFFQDEAATHYEVPVFNMSGRKEIQIEAALQDLQNWQLTVAFDAATGKTLLRLPLTPSHFAAGNYILQLHAPDAGLTEQRTLTVRPPLRRELFRLSSWGHGAASPAWRDFCRRLGFNTIDSYLPAAIPDTLAADGFAYNWHWNVGGHQADPQELQSIQEKTAVHAAELAVFPHWIGTLINSERPVRMPDEQLRERWFDAWAAEEFGTAIPPQEAWKLGGPHNPISAWFVPDEHPGEDGIFERSAAVEWLRWFYNKGALRWRIDAAVAAAVASVRPDVMTWTDPLRYTGQIAALGAGSDWAYGIDPGSVWAQLQTSYFVAQRAAKPYLATLGLSYVRPQWLQVPNPQAPEEMIQLAVSPDDAVQHAWLAIAGIPSAGVNWWAVNHWFDDDSERGGIYVSPGSVERLGTALRDQLLPLGTMLENVPFAPRQVALLLPRETYFLVGGEGKWRWGSVHYPNHWRGWLQQSGLTWDEINEDDLETQALSEYKVIIFPMGLFVSRNIEAQLSAAGAAGTRIIVDRYCRQEYPNMQRWPQGYYHMMPGRERENYGEETIAALKNIYADLAPTAVATAAGADGPVFCFTREINGARYIAVINNHRRPGPYTELTGHDEFQPYGQAQTATVSMLLTAEETLYDWNDNRLLDPTVADGRGTIEVKLGPHEGRLLCILPRPAAELTLSLPEQSTLPDQVDLGAQLSDADGEPLRGRQLVQLILRDPKNKISPQSGWYRLDDGHADIPLRFAINHAAGDWHLEVKEQCTGMQATDKIRVLAREE